MIYFLFVRTQLLSVRASNNILSSSNSRLEQFKKSKYTFLFVISILNFDINDLIISTNKDVEVLV